jgi:hypothetical protein
MEIKELFKNKFLLIGLLCTVALSFFFIKNNEVKNVDTLVSKPPSFSLSKQSKQSSPEVPVKKSGKILSIQHGGGYSFIEVEVPSKRTFFLATASLPNNILVGEFIHWKNPRLSKNYYSHVLKRNFENLLMVTIQDQSIKSGVVTSVKIIDKSTFITVQHDHSTLELIVKSERISDELLVGTKIEWQQEHLSNNEQSKNNNTLSQSPMMVDWIRKSKK